MLDLHVHSTASDGTLLPKEIAERGADFSLFALTDHDNTFGIDEFLSASSSAQGIRLAGIELAPLAGEGYIKFHLLGLGIDHRNSELQDFLLFLRRKRNERNEQIISNLQKLGMKITFDDVLAEVTNGEVVARPHIGRALAKLGYVKDISDAFNRFIGDTCEAYASTHRYHPCPAKTIELIHSVGGIAIMAHPKYWTSDLKRLRSGLAELKDKGLDGIEAIYQANTQGETVDHLMIAKSLGLLVTAGSDFHGLNKPMITLGMQVDDDEKFIAPLVERLVKYGSKFVK